MFLFSILIASPVSAFAGAAPPPVDVSLGPGGTSPQVPIELVQLSLVSSSPVSIPLASDPTNLLGDSIDGFGFVNSQFEIKLSSLRTTPGPKSLGLIQLTLVDPPPTSGINSIHSGDQFHVDSFFDVFFDITITDRDIRPGRDYAGLSDGAIMEFRDVGPVRLTSSYECFAQLAETLFGCIPQARNKLFVGGLPLVIPLGVDINRNGENDKIKIITPQLTPVAVTDIQFPPPTGPYSVSFDSFFDVDTAVVNDESSDPPFIIGLPGQMIILVPGPGALPPLPGFPNDDDPQVIGGKIIPVNTIPLILAGVPSSLIWILPLFAAVGFTVFCLRKN